jgi:predicted metalloprotease
MKIFLLISMLIFTPFSLASYHGESSSGETSSGGSSSGGYGGGGGAIAGILLVVGLVYFLNRDTDTDEVANELLSQNTKKFSDIGPQSNFAQPQNELQLNLKYNLN